ncbi:MAG: VCBS repeat-containing protein [Saprospirales bacterium]|nr:VCBS repeat-containing protein [Saprospirales bacterium]
MWAGLRIPQADSELDNFQVLVSGATDIFHVSDLDGDSDADLVSVIGDTLVWWENLDGATDFGEPQTIGPENGTIRRITTADLDGDNDPEVITVANMSANHKWYENLDGTGNFGAAHYFLEPGTNGVGLQFTDLDGDQDIDVVFAQAANLSILENVDGAGNFSNPLNICFLHNTADDLRAVDINNDGLPDLIAPANNSTQE